MHFDQMAQYFALETRPNIYFLFAAQNIYHRLTIIINNVVIFGLCPNILILQRNFKLIILARFCKTLFLPEFLSDHYEIWTPYSQSSQVFCYDFSSIVFFRINPGFSGSLYY